MSFPSTIHAITFAKTGGVEVIEKSELPFPQQRPGEVLVKVKYAGINYADVYMRMGMFPLPLLVTFGLESAGTIVALPVDDETLENEEFKNRNFSIGVNVVVSTFGGSFAEYISIPWEAVSPLPDSISVYTAAAATVQGLTALTFLTESYPVKQGDTILIHTIAGGVGLLALQIAKAKGATVIGTTSTPEKAALAKAHGADHVIIYRTEDTVKRVLEITEGKGVNAVYDGVGPATFDNNFKLIAKKGTLVSVGNATGVVPPFSIMRLMEKNIKLLRPTLQHYISTPEEAGAYTTELYDLIIKKLVKINVFKEYPFTAEGVKQAQLDLVGGKTTGKLLLKISD